MPDDQEGCAGEGGCEALLSGGSCAVGRVRELRRTGHGVDRPGGPFMVCYLFHCFPFLSQLVVFLLQIIARLITDDQATLDQIRVMGMTHAEVDMSQSEIASLWYTCVPLFCIQSCIYCHFNFFYFRAGVR